MVINTGYLELFGIPCVYMEDDNGLLVVPKDKHDMPKLSHYALKTDYTVQFESLSDKNCTALIERMEFEGENSYRLIPRYIIKAINENPFCSFEMQGDAIDDFFSPSRYFYNKARAGEKKFENLVYGSEVADKWDVIFEEKLVSITLSYGDILRHGVASDLMLHPQLNVDFPETTDLTFIYRLYMAIIRFLQFTRYVTNCGRIKIKLYGATIGDKFNAGRIVDCYTKQSVHHVYLGVIDYSAYKPYVQKILQFVLNNPKLYMHHLPEKESRFFSWNYSPTLFASLFSAFESECRSASEVYEKVDDTGVSNLRAQIVAKIKQIQIDPENKEQQQFVENACSRISQLGTQLGQKKKITQAITILMPSLNSSIENIFICPEMRLKAPLSNTQIDLISGKLTSLRGTVVHGDFSGEFSDVQGRLLKFFEILIYAQMLKRAGLDDSGIEHIVGGVFHCNYVLFEKMIKM